MTQNKSDEQPDKEPDVDEAEHKEAGSGPMPPEARVIHEIVRADGENELTRSTSSLWWSSLGAGLSMGFSFFAMGAIQSRLPAASWTVLVSGFGYTVGFLIAVLGRQQLFTESTLTAMLPALSRRNLATTIQLGRLWTTVLLGNIVGTVAFAWLLSRQGLFDPEITKALKHIAEEAMGDPFWPMVTKSVLAGWLIAVMVWLFPGAGQARMFLIIAITYVVAITHLSHIVAGSVEAAFSVFGGSMTVGEYFTRFALPTLVGNIFGGVSFVALLNHAQVSEEVPTNEGDAE